MFTLTEPQIKVLISTSLQLRLDGLPKELTKPIDDVIYELKEAHPDEFDNLFKGE